MLEEDNNVDLSFESGTLVPDDWSTKVDHRDRNRMKITFKLNNNETEAFTNFQNQTKPDNISESDFIKSVFFLGLSTLETNLTKRIEEELAANDPEVEIPDESDVVESLE